MTQSVSTLKHSIKVPFQFHQQRDVIIPEKRITREVKDGIVVAKLVSAALSDPGGRASQARPSLPSRHSLAKSPGGYFP